MAKNKTKGLILKFEAANPPTVVVAQLGDGNLNLGDREAALDGTSHDDTSGEVTMIDNGFKAPFSYDGEIFLDLSSTSHEAIRAAHASPAGTERATIILPTTGAEQWTGLVRVKSFTIPVPVKGVLKASISIEGMSAATYTA